MSICPILMIDFFGSCYFSQQENVGGTTYFYPTSGENSHNTNDTLNSVSTSSSIASGYQVYPGTPSHIMSLKSKGGSSAFFLSDDTRMDLLNRNALTLMQPDPEQFSGNYNNNFCM